MANQCATTVPEPHGREEELLLAPGHLGDLTRYLPVELVDAVLEESQVLERRRRLLPSRVGVCFVLALSLFPSLGYLRVWDKLTAGLAGRNVCRPSEKALRCLRRRLAPVPLKALFEVVAGPLAQPTTPGTCYRRWRTVAFDGCSAVKVPDCERNRAWLGKVQARLGWAGYPVMRLMTLCETGTRGLLGAEFGPTNEYETAYARRLLRLVDASMLVLADRGFDADDFLSDTAATGAQFVIRITARRRPAILAVLPDGSYLTRMGTLKLRVIDSTITMTTATGETLCEQYRIATTLLDHRRDPAEALGGLYHERWEHESAYYALRHTLQHGLVLRSQDPAGLEQELWAQLIVYQILRTAMADAVESRPGIDPDRASFTIALETARDQLVLTGADGQLAGQDVLVGRIGTAVLKGLLPPRRLRTSARAVKAGRTRYPTKPAELRPRQSRKITTLTVALRSAPACPPEPPKGQREDLRKAATGLRPMGAGNRNRVFHLMSADPERAWRPREVALALGIHSAASFATQMSQWAAEGLLKKIAYGTYALADTWKTTLLTDGLGA
ncbi:IS4 family transposase [Streptomyces sp.]|uniref:IS4 family transposase n=1 Tax=Streptomyces sp. TaxID=1931 RepID=UPI002D769BDC|nr:IS4 family transposase [Streptomyces sp.]HET6357955.1 IS4 family transposase [Streptomyces sp.]